MPRPDRPSTARAGRRRGAGSVLMGLFAALAVAAACVLVLTDDQRLLRLGIVAALWAALVGAFAAARHRRDVAAGLDRADELRQVYELELEREVAARREHELTVTADAHRAAEDEVRGELDGLRTEIHALRRHLEAMLGGEVLVERVALRAESTRVRSLSDQSRGARSGEPALPAALPDGTQGRPPIRAVGPADTGTQRPVAPQPRQEARPMRPAAARAGDVPPTEVFPRYQAPGPRRHDSRPIDVGARPSDPHPSRPIDVGRPGQPPRGPRPHDSRPIDVSRLPQPAPRPHDSGLIELSRGPRPHDSRPIDVSGNGVPRHDDQRPQQPAPADSGRWSVVANPAQPVAPAATVHPANGANGANGLNGTAGGDGAGLPRRWAGVDQRAASTVGSAASTSSANGSAASSATSPTSGGRRRRAELASVDSAGEAGGAYVGRRRRPDEEPSSRSVDDLLASYRAAEAAEPRRRRREGA